jgi:hypothetical protein
MLWFSVRQETAEVCGPRLTNRIQGWAYLKCIRLSAYYRLIKFASEVAACFAVTVSGGWLLFHGNHGSRANNRGNVFHFPRDCMVFKASRTSISFCMHLSSMVSGHTGGAVVNCIVCTFVYVFLFVTPAWFGHYGFLEDEGLIRHAGEKQLRRWSNCKGTSVFCQKDLRSEVCSAEPKVFLFLVCSCFSALFASPCGCF